MKVQPVTSVKRSCWNKYQPRRALTARAGWASRTPIQLAAVAFWFGCLARPTWSARRHGSIRAVSEKASAYMVYYSLNRACSMGFSQTTGLVKVAQPLGLCFPSKMCFPLGTYRHRRTTSCYGCYTEVGRFQNMYKHN